MGSRGKEEKGGCGGKSRDDDMLQVFGIMRGLSEKVKTRYINNYIRRNMFKICSRYGKVPEFPNSSRVAIWDSGYCHFFF